MSKSNNAFWRFARNVTMFFVIMGGIFVFIMTKEMYPVIKAKNERQKILDEIHEPELSGINTGQIINLQNIDGIKIRTQIKGNQIYFQVDTTEFKSTQIFNDKLYGKEYYNQKTSIARISLLALNRDYKDKYIRRHLLEEDLFRDVKTEENPSSFSDIFEKNTGTYRRIIPVSGIPSGYNDPNCRIFYNHIRYFKSTIPSNCNLLSVNIIYSNMALPQTYNYIVLKH